MMDEKKDRDLVASIIGESGAGIVIDGVSVDSASLTYADIAAARTIEVDGRVIKSNKAPAAVDVRHAGLPVAGYAKTVSDEALQLVNQVKFAQERVLRLIDSIKASGVEFDPRNLAVGWTDLEKGFGNLSKALFQPGGQPRISLPEDSENPHIYRLKFAGNGKDGSPKFIFDGPNGECEIVHKDGSLCLQKTTEDSE